MKHFKRSEFINSVAAVQARIENVPPPYISKNLDFTIAGAERIRHLLGEPMMITSGYRCQELNEIVKGSKTSQHMQGEAFDFIAPDYGTPQDIFEDLFKYRFILGIDQLILEPSWVHVSFTLNPRYEFLNLS